MGMVLSCFAGPFGPHHKPFGKKGNILNTVLSGKPPKQQEWLWLPHSFAEYFLSQTSHVKCKLGRNVEKNLLCVRGLRVFQSVASMIHTAPRSSETQNHGS